MTAGWLGERRRGPHTKKYKQNKKRLEIRRRRGGGRKNKRNVSRREEDKKKKGITNFKLKTT